MKSFIIIIALLSLPIQSWAQSRVQKRVTKPSESFFDGEKNYFQAGVGFGFGETSIGDRYSSDFAANQLNIETGMTIGLPYNFATTTILGYHMINTNDDDLLDELGNQVPKDTEVDTFNSFDISLRQRLLYNWEIKSVTIRPFTEFGIAFGENSFAISSSSTKSAIESDWSYNRIFFAFGTEVKYERFLPYVRLAFSDVNYSDEREQIYEKDGKSTSSKIKSTRSERDGSNFIAAAGVGYQF